MDPHPLKSRGIIPVIRTSCGRRVVQRDNKLVGETALKRKVSAIQEGSLWKSGFCISPINDDRTVLDSRPIPLEAFFIPIRSQYRRLLDIGWSFGMLLCVWNRFYGQGSDSPTVESTKLMDRME
jgi:hypothetical protein